jgi:hypothetical protein
LIGRIRANKERAFHTVKAARSSGESRANCAVVIVIGGYFERKFPQFSGFFPQFSGFFPQFSGFILAASRDVWAPSSRAA